MNSICNRGRTPSTHADQNRPSAGQSAPHSVSGHRRGDGVCRDAPDIAAFPRNGTGYTDGASECALEEHGWSRVSVSAADARRHGGDGEVTAHSTGGDPRICCIDVDVVDSHHDARGHRPSTSAVEDGPHPAGLLTGQVVVAHSAVVVRHHGAHS